MARHDNFHSLADARSWALHGEVAAQLPLQPELLARAKDRVVSWMNDSKRHPYAADWHNLLLLPPAQLQEALLDKVTG